MSALTWIQTALQRSTKSLSHKGFTLVEILVAMAIVAVLAAIALPAYNNYTTKSKFAEVMTASNPTKTAIAACATTGDCIAANAISLVNTTPIPSVVVATGTTVPIPSNGVTPANTTWIQCSGENGSCPFTGTYTVLYGTTSSNIQKTVSGGSACTNGQFTDPAVNYVKTCWVAVPNSILADEAPGGANSYLRLPCIDSSTHCSPPTKYTASVQYSYTGVVTATATSFSGLNAETFTLTPSYSSGRVDWLASGSCKTRANGALC